MNAASLLAWLPTNFWLERCMTLGGGSAAIVLLAALLTWRGNSARWQRGCWQAAALGLLTLFVGEVVGAGDLVTIAARRWYGPQFVATQPVAMADATQVDDSSRPANFRTPDATSDVEAVRSAATSNTNPLPHLATPAQYNIGTADNELVSSHDNQRAFNELPENKQQSARQATPTVAHANPNASALPSSGAASANDFNNDSDNVSPWPMLIWLCGALFCLTRCTIGWLKLQRLLKLATPVDAVCQQRVMLLAARLDLGRKVRLVTLPGLTGPVAFGLWRPTIGLPSGFDRQFSPAEQEAMLAHELAHLAGADPGWRLLADLAAAVWWWQPLAWWSRTRLEASCEAVADEASLLLDDGPETLAACLVTLGKQLLRPRTLGWNGIAGGGFRSGLGRRVTRLLNLQGHAWRTMRGGSLIVCTAACLLAAAALASTAGVRRSIWESKGEATMNIGKVFRQSLGGMALLAALGTGSNPLSAEEGDAPQPPKPPRLDREAPADPPPLRREEPRGEERRPDDRRGPDGDRRGPVDPPRQRGANNEGRIEQLKRDIRRLREESKLEESGKLEKELQSTMLNTLKHILPQLPEEERGVVQKHFESYFALRSEGKFEEAEKLERAAKETMQRFAGKIVPPEQKLHHLRGAADNLRAAGKADLAEKLMQEVRELEKDLGFPPMPEGPREQRAPGRDEPRPADGERRRPDGERREPEGDRPGREGDRRGPEGERQPGGRGRDDGPARREDRREGDDRRPEDGPQQELTRVLRELRGDIENLRREVKELREKVKD